MQWISTLSRMSLVIAAGALLGWNFGNPLAGVAVAACGLLLFWSHQMLLLQRWLADSQQPPADLFGIWGDIVAKVYKDQREAVNEKGRLQSMVDYLLESFASMRDGVVIVETNGSIRWCNDAAQGLLGLRYPDDIGQAITNLVREPEFSEYLNVADFTKPLLFSTAGDIEYHLQLNITRFAEGDNLMFVRDVTDRVKIEQMRRDFVGNVSHELRTPLTVITGYLETMLAAPEQLPAPYIKPIKQMVQQSQRMEALLTDLLWLSRIEGDERVEKLDIVDIPLLLQQLQEELQGVEPEREIRLQLDSDHKVFGDYRELYSAVSNLVLNAKKYSPGSSPVVVSWVQKEGAYHLSVRDNGIGIDQTHFPRLTERFYRVDDSRSSTTGGTGLGLAIVKHVAVAHGAELDIQSQLGRGSTFSLIFHE